MWFQRVLPLHFVANTCLHFFFVRVRVYPFLAPTLSVSLLVNTALIFGSKHCTIVLFLGHAIQRFCGPLQPEILIVNNPASFSVKLILAKLPLSFAKRNRIITVVF
jgi:hypothetical protein